MRDFTMVLDLEEYVLHIDGEPTTMKFAVAYFKEMEPIVRGRGWMDVEADVFHAIHEVYHLSRIEHHYLSLQLNSIFVLIQIENQRKHHGEHS